MNTLHHLRRLLTAGALTLGLALAPARAHFIWLEPQADTGTVQACFGEYPKEREEGKLLDLVAKVSAEAVTDSGRTPLASTRGTNGYAFAGATAPVYAAELDYGVVRRGENDPYQLRYEALYLAGDGQPLPLSEIARLSKLDAGLDLDVDAAPLEQGRLALTLSKGGQPQPLELTLTVPGDAHTTALTADSLGRVTVPVRPGMNYLRILEQSPATVEGQDDVKLQKTYQLVTFNAALEGEAECSRLLHEAHEARAAWPADFPGFTAKAVATMNGVRSEGTLAVEADYKVKLDVANEAKAALMGTLHSLVMHRRGGNPEYSATWLDDQPHAMGRAIALHDDYDSVYRLEDKQIKQVTRLVEGGWFVTNVLENFQTPDGYYLPKFYTVTWYHEDGTIQSTSTMETNWIWQNETFLPQRIQRVETNSQGETQVLSLELSEHKFLP